MPKVHSHYENPKVARDAPPEVIRAAYRSLSLKYHPDRNPGDTDASRIMSILNTAFEILSDSEKRREHDRWIAQAEAAGAETQNKQQKGNRSSAFSEENRQQTATSSSFDLTKKSIGRILCELRQPIAAKAGQVVAHLFRYRLWYGIGVFVIIGALNNKSQVPPPGPKPYVAEPITQKVVPEYVRPTTAPNGEPWPVTSGYVVGYDRMNTNGLSTVTIDNTQNDSDVFVKLVSLDGQNAFPVRTFFISAYDKFTLNQVNAGNYDIRYRDLYRDLNTGRLSRSESFRLQEIPIDNGTQYSTLTMTLYKVSNGNMQTYELAENEF
jgi:hypothetical protein